MILGHKNTSSETATLINDSTIHIRENKRELNPLLISILPILSMLIAILPGILNKNAGVDIAKLAILALVLTAAATFYIRLSAENILKQEGAKYVVTLGYLSSILLLFIIPNPEILCFWMLGVLVVAMLVDNKLGVFLHFNLTVLMGITLSLHLGTMIQILILGVLMCMLSDALKNKSTIIYAIIIILSTNITLAFAINNFIFDTDLNYNYLTALFSILVVLLAAYFLSMLYKKVIRKDTYNEKMDISFEALLEGEPTNESSTILSSPSSEITEPEVSLSASIEETTSSVEAELNQTDMDQMTVSELEIEKMELESNLQRNLELRTSYEILCDTENELLKKLKLHSETLYFHSLHIGDLSCRAAMEIGANELLAKAGGFYHEIGKINGKNYIEEGLVIAEDYSFPKELKAILKEHNIKYDKPNSVEAAIVMLSDNVVSTIEYIEKSDDHKFTTNKIIDNIFQMRMDKGTFDTSNLALKDFKKLKEFYQNEFKK